MSTKRQKDKHECYICHKKMRYDFLVKQHFPNVHKKAYVDPLLRGQRTLPFGPAATSSQQNENAGDDSGPQPVLEDHDAPHDEPVPVHEEQEHAVEEIQNPIVFSSEQFDRLLRHNEELTSLLLEVQSSRAHPISQNPSSSNANQYHHPQQQNEQEQQDQLGQQSQQQQSHQPQQEQPQQQQSQHSQHQQQSQQPQSDRRQEERDQPEQQRQDELPNPNLVEAVTVSPQLFNCFHIYLYEIIMKL